ncbi:Zn-dependent hydrolase [Gracilaria domingensis]|nr:Zn-dependent hydrolase [Gracilaria domingensis]
MTAASFPSTTVAATLPFLFVCALFVLAFRPLLRLDTPLHTPPLTNGTDDSLTLAANEVVGQLRTLSRLSESAEFLNRPFLSKASAEAQRALLRLMSDAGLEAFVDGAGNVRGTLSCSDANSSRRTLLMGSHHDTVANAGHYDGMLGILTAIAVTRLYRNSICSLPFDLSVVAFDDEEGNNAFAVTNFGARALIGHDLSHVTGKQSFQSAHNSLFSTPDVDASVRAAALTAVEINNLLAYIELHIEQGPVLEQLNRPLGAVNAIAGQTRMRVRLDGHAAHAGTVPMTQRRDALAAAAQLVLEIESLGLAHSHDHLVATVGKLEVAPGATNVVPGEVSFSVDVRSRTDTIRKDVVQDIVDAVESVGRKRGIAVQVDVVHDVDAVHMSEWLVNILQEVAGGDTLTSGAGHDAQFMAKVTDAGMLFVRCKQGISHSPEEYVSDEDVYHGLVALKSAVERVAEKGRH